MALAHYDVKRALKLYCDVSAYGLGIPTMTAAQMQRWALMHIKTQLSMLMVLLTAVMIACPGCQ